MTFKLLLLLTAIATKASAEWLDDGTQGTAASGATVSCVVRPEGDTRYNALWHEGKGVVPGPPWHYYRFTVKESTGLSVCLTDEENFLPRYKVRGFCFNGVNLSDGNGLLLQDYGDRRLLAGDEVSMVAARSADRLKIYYYVNRRCLGLAFDVEMGARTGDVPLRPMIGFKGPGTVVIEDLTDDGSIPRTDRQPEQYEGIEGKWSTESLHRGTTVRIDRVDSGSFDVIVQFLNTMRVRLHFAGRADWGEVESRSPVVSTQMAGSPEEMAADRRISELLEGVTAVELDGQRMRWQSPSEVVVFDRAAEAAIVPVHRNVLEERTQTLVLMQ